MFVPKVRSVEFYYSCMPTHCYTASPSPIVTKKNVPGRKSHNEQTQPFEPVQRFRYIYNWGLFLKVRITGFVVGMVAKRRQQAFCIGRALSTNIISCVTSSENFGAYRQVSLVASYYIIFIKKCNIVDICIKINPHQQYWTSWSGRKKYRYNMRIFFTAHYRKMSGSSYQHILSRLTSRKILSWKAINYGNKNLINFKLCSPQF